ncbi:MAG: hypothetical protein HY329_17095 [Chloroflexi bacterium]|nr:hypothetical protein [Chloroflexota bacterium]
MTLLQTLAPTLAPIAATTATERADLPRLHARWIEAQAAVHVLTQRRDLLLKLQAQELAAIDRALFSARQDARGARADFAHALRAK